MNTLANQRSQMLIQVLQNVNLHYGWVGVQKVLMDFEESEVMDIVVLSFGSHHSYVEKVKELFRTK